MRDLGIEPSGSSLSSSRFHQQPRLAGVDPRAGASLSGRRVRHASEDRLESPVGGQGIEPCRLRLVRPPASPAASPPVAETDRGDARVTIPSRTRSRRAGFTCSLASQSGTRESNSACPAPEAGGAPCAMSQVVPRARVERASLRFQRSAVTGSAVEGFFVPRAGVDPAPAP